eukprot:INCI14591.1.p1 GENE.INCI14591.1~~INCI14591.1.p1  ORF type:complete len:317 (+),score=35.09 INCI14591.1:155-1105(+)
MVKDFLQWPPSPQGMWQQGLVGAASLAAPIFWLLRRPPASTEVSASPAVLRRLGVVADTSTNFANFSGQLPSDRVAFGHSNQSAAAEASAPQSPTRRQDELRTRIHDSLYSQSELTVGAIEDLIVAIEAYDRMRNETTVETPLEPETPGGSVPTTAAAVHAWRTQLRHRVVLALERATQLQSFRDVSRLLRAYSTVQSAVGHELKSVAQFGVDAQRNAGGNDSTSVRDTDEVILVRHARSLLAGRWTRWVRRLKTLGHIARANLLWLLLGFGTGVVHGIWQSVFYRYFGMLQNAAFEGKVRAAWHAAAALIVHQVG